MNLALDENDNFRHFMPEGYQELHELMERMGQGDRAASNMFLQKIQQPFVNKVAQRIAAQVWQDKAIDQSVLEDVTQDVLAGLIKDTQNPRYFQGDVQSWASFATAFQTYLYRHLLSLQKSEEHKYDAEGEYAKTRAAQADTHTEPEHCYTTEQTREALKKFLSRTINPRATSIIMDRLEGETFEEMSKKLNVSKARVKQIEDAALKKLNKNAGNKEGFVERELQRKPLQRGVE